MLIIFNSTQLKRTTTDAASQVINTSMSASIYLRSESDDYFLPRDALYRIARAVLLP